MDIRQRICGADHGFRLSRSAFARRCERAGRGRLGPLPGLPHGAWIAAGGVAACPWL